MLLCTCDPTWHQAVHAPVTIVQPLPSSLAARSCICGFVPYIGWLPGMLGLRSQYVHLSPAGLHLVHPSILVSGARGIRPYCRKNGVNPVIEDVEIRCAHNA